MGNTDKDAENAVSEPFFVTAKIRSAQKWNLLSKHVLMQFSVIFCTDLGGMSTGLCLGFSGVVLPQISQDATIRPTTEDESWIASITVLSSSFGCLLSALCTDRIGRKRTMMLVAVPFFVGWVVIALAHSLAVLLLGRFLTGLGMGLTTAAMQMYLSEVVEVPQRAIIGATPTMALTIGTLLSFCLGPVVSWRTLALVSAAVPVVLFCSMTVLPDSPAWLMVTGRVKEAEAALTMLRKPGHDVAAELKSFSENKTNNSAKWGEIFGCFKNPEVWKPFCLLFVIFCAQQFSGGLVMLFYAASIFQKLEGGPDMYTSTILLGVIRAFFTCMLTVFLRLYGIRPLLLFSGAIMSVSTLTIAVYSVLESVLEYDLPLPWLPAAGVLIFVMGFTPGFGTLPWILLGDVFPMNVRGTYTCILSSMCHMLVFLAVKTFPMLLDSLKDYGTFFLYSGFSIFGTLFVFVALPETRGKSLKEIEDYFRTQDFFHWRIS